MEYFYYFNFLYKIEFYLKHVLQFNYNVHVHTLVILPICEIPIWHIPLFRPDPDRKLSANLYDVYHCYVYSEETPDEGQRNCPKHVEFYSKNKFEKLVHLVGFIKRMTKLLVAFRNFVKASTKGRSNDVLR